MGASNGMKKSVLIVQGVFPTFVVAWLDRGSSFHR